MDTSTEVVYIPEGDNSGKEFLDRDRTAITTVAMRKHTPNGPVGVMIGRYRQNETGDICISIALRSPMTQQFLDATKRVDRPNESMIVDVEIPETRFNDALESIGYVLTDPLILKLETLHQDLAGVVKELHEAPQWYEASILDAYIVLRTLTSRLHDITQGLLAPEEEDDGS